MPKWTHWFRFVSLNLFMQSNIFNNPQMSVLMEKIVFKPLYIAWNKLITALATERCWSLFVVCMLKLNGKHEENANQGVQFTERSWEGTRFQCSCIYLHIYLLRGDWPLFSPLRQTQINRHCWDVNNGRNAFILCRMLVEWDFWYEYDDDGEIAIRIQDFISIFDDVQTICIYLWK